MIKSKMSRAAKKAWVTRRRNEARKKRRPTIPVIPPRRDPREVPHSIYGRDVFVVSSAPTGGKDFKWGNWGAD